MSTRGKGKTAFRRALTGALIASVLLVACRTSEPPICPAKLIVCEDGVVEECKSDGSSWKKIDSCAQDQVCFLASCCIPDCGDRTCGGDGCGGTCGDCAADSSCVQGDCCKLDCAWNDCGPDVCGGACGSCSSGFVFEETKCTSSPIECDDGNDSPWDGCHDGFISELKINQCLWGEQEAPKVVQLSQNELLFHWTSRFDLCYDIMPDGPEEFAKPCSAGEGPELPCGGEKEYYAASVQGRSFELANSQFETEFITFIAQEPYLPASWLSATVAPLAGGKLAMAWELDGKLGGTVSTGQGSEVRWGWDDWDVISEDAGAPLAVVVGEAQAAVFWTSGLDVMVTLASSEEISLGQSSVVMSTAEQPPGNLAVHSLPSGGFVFGWDGQSPTQHPVNDESRVTVQGLDSKCSAVGAPSTIGQADDRVQLMPAFASLKEGTIVVVWESMNPKQANLSALNSGRKVEGQLLSKTGEILGEAFSVDPEVIVEGFFARPRVAATEYGEFIVVWTASDDDMSGVFAQRFDASAVKIGGKIRVNSTADGRQQNASVVALPSGRFVVTWEGDSKADVPGLIYYESTDIFAQVFSRQGYRMWRSCNDGLCGDDETCQSCPKDCGACP